MKLLLIFLLVAFAAACLQTLSAPSSMHAEASDLTVAQNCQADGRVQVSFGWRGNNPAALLQMVDLSIFSNGWVLGTFLGAGPISPIQQFHTWPGLRAGEQHYVRVNQLFANVSWDPSATYAFRTVECTGMPNTAATIPQGRMGALAPIASSEAAWIGDRYIVHIRAGLPNGCAMSAGVETEAIGGSVRVRVLNSMPTGNVPCTEIYRFYEVEVDLTGLVARAVPYRLELNGEATTRVP